MLWLISIPKQHLWTSEKDKVEEYMLEVFSRTLGDKVTPLQEFLVSEKHPTLLMEAQKGEVAAALDSDNITKAVAITGGKGPSGMDHQKKTHNNHTAEMGCRSLQNLQRNGQIMGSTPSSRTIGQFPTVAATQAPGMGRSHGRGAIAVARDYMQSQGLVSAPGTRCVLNNRWLHDATTSKVSVEQAQKLDRLGKSSAAGWILEST